MREGGEKRSPFTSIPSRESRLGHTQGAGCVDTDEP